MPLVFNQCRWCLNVPLVFKQGTRPIKAMDTSASSRFFQSVPRLFGSGPRAQLVLSLKRAVHGHMSKCKGCHGSEVKKISVMTRPGDVIAGCSGCMGPCPPPQHQPPVIMDIPVYYLTYTWFISRYKTYAQYILDIYQIYTFLIWYMSGICLVYEWKNHVM